MKWTLNYSQLERHARLQIMENWVFCLPLVTSFVWDVLRHKIILGELRFVLKIILLWEFKRARLYLSGWQQFALIRFFVFILCPVRDRGRLFLIGCVISLCQRSDLDTIIRFSYHHRTYNAIIVSTRLMSFPIDFNVQANLSKEFLMTTPSKTTFSQFFHGPPPKHYGMLRH